MGLMVVWRGEYLDLSERKITGGWRKLCNEEFRYVHYIPDVIKTISRGGQHRPDMEHNRRKREMDAEF